MSFLDQTISTSAHNVAGRDWDRKNNSLGRVLGSLNPGIRSEWAWKNYRNTIEALAREFGHKRLIEIGGGRDPLLSLQAVKALGFDYTINDISPEELKNAPEGYNTACFDVSGDLKSAGIKSESYDLAFSRMVFEHVQDVGQAWKNLHEILTPGGVGLIFVPTLYALPYVANLMIPEWLSQKIVKLLYPHRTDHEDPKFPAYYDWCYSSEKKLEPMLRAAGFSETLIVPFYGHAYFDKLPVIREIDEAVTRMAIRNDWRFLTPYAYIIALK